MESYEERVPGRALDASIFKKPQPTERSSSNWSSNPIYSQTVLARMNPKLSQSPLSPNQTISRTKDSSIKDKNRIYADRVSSSIVNHSTFHQKSSISHQISVEKKCPNLNSALPAHKNQGATQIKQFLNPRTLKRPSSLVSGKTGMNFAPAGERAEVPDSMCADSSQSSDNLHGQSILTKHECRRVDSSVTQTSSPLSSIQSRLASNMEAHRIKSHQSNDKANAFSGTMNSSADGLSIRSGALLSCFIEVQTNITSGAFEDPSDAKSFSSELDAQNFSRGPRKIISTKPDETLQRNMLCSQVLSNEQHSDQEFERYWSAYSLS